MRLPYAVGVARQKEYPRNHSTFGVYPSGSSQRFIAPTGSALPSGGAGLVAAELTGSAGQASGCGCASIGKLAAPQGRMDALDASALASASGVPAALLEAAASSLAFAFGLVASSAKRLGTIRIAIAVVAINRAARFIVAP